MGPDSLEQVQMDPNWSKLFQKGLNGSKWDNQVLICPNWFKWVHRGPKQGSKIIMNSIGWPLNPGLLGLVLSLSHLLLKYIYSAITPKLLKIVLPVIEQAMLTFCRDYKLCRASKSLHWFKSYVDFENREILWWSCFRKGLRPGVK